MSDERDEEGDEEAVADEATPTADETPGRTAEGAVEGSYQLTNFVAVPLKSAESVAVDGVLIVWGGEVYGPGDEQVLVTMSAAIVT